MAVTVRTHLVYKLLVITYEIISVVTVLSLGLFI